MNITDEHLAEFHRLAPMLAPELARAPLYFLRHSEALGPLDSSTRAFATSYVNARTRDMLIESNQWQGQGGVIVFAGDDEWNSEDEIYQTFVHESAHLLPFAPPPLDRESSPREQANENRIIELEAKLGFSAHHVVGQPPWYPAHGFDFTRCTLHLWWRLAFAGRVVGQHLLCGGFLYGLSPGSAYFLALGDEPIRMRDRTFTEILATEPPDAFSQLWNEDREFFNSQPSHQRLRKSDT
jgi:hypothetical protein